MKIVFRDYFVLLMEIKNSHLFCALIMVLAYVYCVDLFKQESFQESLKENINKTLGNYTSHSVVSWIEQKTNAIAAATALSGVAILRAIPVGRTI